MSTSAEAPVKVHLGFDMGIRNLAYCIVRHVGATWSILAWDNVDLLEGVTAQDAKTCVACSGPAKWRGPDTKKWCQACATQKRVKKAAKEKPAFPTLPCAQSVVALRGLLGEAGVEDVKKMKKDALLTWVSARYLMPWKPVKTMEVGLLEIRRAMNRWLDGVLPQFAAATLIRLENQPVMKGPTMKSVQMILFTLLGHRLEREYGWSGAIEFVHAGTKTRGTVAPTEPAGGAGLAVDEGKAYRERKKTAETETVEKLRGCSEWLRWFESRKKKSDLADAFLMALRNA